MVWPLRLAARRAAVDAWNLDPVLITLLLVTGMAMIDFKTLIVVIVIRVFIDFFRRCLCPTIESIRND